MGRTGKRTGADQEKSKAEQLKLALQYAAENRKSEISLLWTRAAYFWAFLAASFVAYAAALQGNRRTVALLLACFGALCSWCWTLSNRSGKYWQEIWEKKVESLEVDVLGRKLFSADTNPAVEKRWIFGPKRYSPSRLAIAVSDLSLIAWSLIVFSTFWDFTAINAAVAWTMRAGIVVGALFYGWVVWIWCRSGTAPSFGKALRITFVALRGTLKRRNSN